MHEPHFILGHILDNLSDGYMTCTNEFEMHVVDPRIEDEWSANVQYNRVFGSYRFLDSGYRLFDEVDTGSFKRQLFEELEGSSSFPAEDNYPEVAFLEGNQITSDAINSASGGVLVLRDTLVHIPTDVSFSGLLIVESSNITIGGGDGPSLTGKMLLMPGENAFDGNLRITVYTGKVVSEQPFELEPRVFNDALFILWLHLSIGEIEVLSSILNKWWVQNRHRMRFDRLIARIMASNSTGLFGNWGWAANNEDYTTTFDISSSFQHIDSPWITAPSYEWSSGFLLVNPEEIILNFVNTHVDSIPVERRTMINLAARRTDSSDISGLLEALGIREVFEEHDAIEYDRPNTEGNSSETVWGPSNVHYVGVNEYVLESSGTVIPDPLFLQRVADKIVEIMERRALVDKEEEEE